jgi:16S rRNA (guanine966-N2)-methyltransferase
MRIIAGKLKGRRLVSFNADHIRPTTDRVKESIFNKIQFLIDGSRVLDLFSGTGNLAIESYSRGACHVTAVEKNPKSIQIIKKNLEALNILREIDVVTSDVFSFLSNYKGEAFDIVLIDPPFTEKLSHEILKKIGSSKVLNESTQIIIESAKGETVETNYLNLKFLDQRSFGDKKVSFFTFEKDQKTTVGCEEKI